MYLEEAAGRGKNFPRSTVEHCFGNKSSKVSNILQVVSVQLYLGSVKVIQYNSETDLYQ